MGNTLDDADKLLRVVVLPVGGAPFMLMALLFAWTRCPSPDAREAAVFLQARHYPV